MSEDLLLSRANQSLGNSVVLHIDLAASIPSLTNFEKSLQSKPSVLALKFCNHSPKTMVAHKAFIFEPANLKVILCKFIVFNSRTFI